MRATYGLLVAISLLLLSAVPSAFALESPEPVTPQRDSAGKIRIRLICGNRATDARMALLVKYPEVQVVTASGDDELTDAGLAHLKSLPKLESLGLGGSKITADGLAHLCGNSSLRSLTLWEMPLSEKAAEQIAAIPNLELLRYGGKVIEPRAWPHLARIPNLRDLSFANYSLVDADVGGLKEFTHLQALSFEGSGFTSAVVANVTGNAGLRKLTLKAFPLSDTAAGQIATLRELESLSLNHVPVTQAGWKSLATLPHLRSLQIYGDTVADADLPVFEGFTRLCNLDLSSSLITEPTTHALRAALPNTLVNLYRWKHTVDDLKAMSKEVKLDSAGHVIVVNMSCLKYATDEKLRIVDNFPAITSLRAFGGRTLTNDGLQSITGLQSLEVLELKSPVVTDAGLMHLQKMTTLRQVRLMTPAVTDQGIADLQNALPDCRVARWLPGDLSKETADGE